MTLHVYQANKQKRVRRKCPYHKHLCYGTLYEYYDTSRVTFDCGANIDYGYGEWREPPKKKCPNCRKWFRPIEMIEHLKEHKVRRLL